MDPLRKHITAAMQELSKHSLHDIQCETALKWAGRACAAMVLKRPDVEAHEYAHEALEHAALCGDDRVLRIVREALDAYGVDA